MIPREIIKQNLTFSNPERIGLAFPDYGNDDFCRSGIGLSATWQEKRWTEGKFEYYDDEWGNIWRRISRMSEMGEIIEPALKDWGMLKKYRYPDLSEPSRFAAAAEIFQKSPDLYHLGNLPGYPFAICRYLRRLDAYLQDLILERNKIDILHEKVIGILEKAMERFAKAGADGIFFAEDWGTQDRLMVSPAMWREIFKPIFKRLCDTAHRLGLHVFMHSCGYIWDIIDDLAETGINCLQFDQPGLYGLERLSKKLRGLQVCLYSPVDVQRVLPSGNRQFIKSEAQRMARLFTDNGGGFIAKTYGDLKGIGVNPQWARWAYEAFLESRKTKQPRVKKYL